MPLRRRSKEQLLLAAAMAVPPPRRAATVESALTVKDLVGSISFDAGDGGSSNNANAGIGGALKNCNAIATTVEGAVAFSGRDGGSSTPARGNGGECSHGQRPGREHQLRRGRWRQFE